MSTNRTLLAFIRSWWIFVVAIVLGSLCAFALSAVAVPQYTATSTLFFSPGTAATANDLNQSAAYTQNQMLSFAQLAVSPTVLAPVIAKLRLNMTTDELARSITVTTPQNTVIMTAAVTNMDPVQASQISNEFAKSIVTAVTKIVPVSTTKSSSVSAHIIAEATTPISPSSPDTRRNVLTGGLIGLLVGALIIFAREQLSPKVRSVDDVAAVTSAPLLGTFIREPKRLQSLGGQVLSKKNVESCRKLAAHLVGIVGHQQKLSLLVTAPIVDGERSRIALGLASALAERGRRVLLVDSDIRNAAIANLTALKSVAGLESVLTENTDYSSAVVPFNNGEFDVLVSGPHSAEPVVEEPTTQEPDATSDDASESVHRDPGALLASRAMSELIATLRTEYDVLIIDAAPLNSVADAAILGTLVEGTIVVVDSKRTHPAQLAATMNALSSPGINVLGIALSGMSQKR